MELLIGCGYAREKMVRRNERSEWSDLRTLDHNLECKPDIVHDLDQLPYPVEDNSCDEIHAYCVLEHCGRQGDWRFFFAQWSEFWRIAKPGGTFHGLCPAFGSPWAWGDPSHTRIISLESLVFLNQKSYEGLGSTPMSDYRGVYKANWQLEWHEKTGDGRLAFILMALK